MDIMFIWNPHVILWGIFPFVVMIMIHICPNQSTTEEAFRFVYENIVDKKCPSFWTSYHSWLIFSWLPCSNCRCMLRKLVRKLLFDILMATWFLVTIFVYAWIINMHPYFHRFGILFTNKSTLRQIWLKKAQIVFFKHTPPVPKISNLLSWMCSWRAKTAKCQMCI